MKIYWLILPLLCLLTVACSPRDLPEITWEQAIQDLYAPESIADISLPCTEIYTSYDRTGGNNDFSNGFKNLGDGWLELADLKGPGVLTRFWFTGIKREARFRFVFDDEDAPRLEASCDAFYKDEAGFPEAFTATDQNCYYSGFPIPYGKRLRILISDEGYSQGKGKLYFQINATRLKNQIIASAQFPVPESVAAAAEISRAGFSQPVVGEPLQQTFTLAGGETRDVLLLESEGIIRQLRIEPDGWDGMTFHQRRLLLRQIWLQISWDGSDAASVHVPLGDFFGQVWEPKQLTNLYFSVDDTGFACRFPMPFRKSAVVALNNHGKTAVSGTISVLYDAQPVPADLGYFHCGWMHSSENLQGSPHEVLNVKGRGRLAGCLLGVASMDRSFWVLESDETILRDHSKEVFWQGTGLEDYFNGGWYYRAVFQNPLFGLTVKRPFRTVQYRYHLADAVTFDKALHMVFERGPDNKSRAVFDSTVYYYLDRPAAAPASPFRKAWLNPPPDEFEARSLMTRLWDYEKFGDRVNAEKLTEHALQYWKYPPEIKALLEVRLLAYQAELNGYETVRERFHALSASGSSSAKSLIRYYEQGATLLFAYSNKKAVVYLDGKKLLTATDPVRCRTVAVDLPSGRHVLAVETDARSWPDWVQAGLKKGNKIMGTDLTWTCCVNPVGDWNSPLYDDSGWDQFFDFCKGPPEQEAVPFVYPNSFVFLHSAVTGLKPQKLPADTARLVFRKVFEVE